MAYPLPSGANVKFLNDQTTYMCIYQQVLRGVGRATKSVIGGFMQLGAKVGIALIGARLLHSLDVVWMAWPISFVAGSLYPFWIYRKYVKK